MTEVCRDIAVIGIGCRFPGNLNDPQSFWSFLTGKHSAIREIPSDRWAIDAFYRADPAALGWTRSKWGGFLDDVFGFDAAFFDLAPAEATHMDPQQRLLLQVAYEATQDAGLTLADLSRARTGVFTGISTSDYAGMARHQRQSTDIWAGSGYALSIAANRISHRLNLNGPSYAVDTACSSALVAVDQACRNLLTGSCDIALAGGVNCLLDPAPFISFSNANMLSRTGKVSSFDAKADGFLRAEGCGLVLLKPLSAALADGNRVYAVISGTAINQDGRTSTMTAPSGAAQEAMLQELMAGAPLTPRQVGYVEAHGTGTQTGDPIEAHAVGHVFAGPSRDEPLMIGSVKPNIGHLESAAGAAGLIKAVLAVHHGEVPPNINFEDPNPEIPFDALNIEVPVETRPLPERDGETAAVVNSFGFGGTNASALIRRQGAQEARSEPQNAHSPDRTVVPGWIPVPLSAPSQQGLAAWAGSAGELTAHGVSAADLAHSLAFKRDRFAERAVVLCKDDAQGLSEGLEYLSLRDDPAGNTDRHPHVLTGRRQGGNKLAFTFSGQGTQRWDMARGVLRQEPVFRETVREFDGHFSPLAGWSVLDELTADEAASNIDRNDVTQACLVAVHLGLARLWMSRGVVPDLVIGHSLGEIAAACIGGAISMETAANIIHKRGLIHRNAPEPGRMAAVGLTAEQLATYLPDDTSVEIGAYNSPAMVTVTGRERALETLLERIRSDLPGTMIRPLNTGFAWHSELLDYGKDWFLRELGGVPFRAPEIPVLSTVTGRFQDRFDLDYWWSNLRRPVRYAQAIELGLDLDVDTFLEIGPHRTVSPLTAACAQARRKPVLAVPSLDRDMEDSEAIARATGTLFVHGVEPDWAAILPASESDGLRLPLYPWQNKTYRLLSAEARTALFTPVSHPLLGRRDNGPVLSWTSVIDHRVLPYLKDHMVSGSCVFPAAGYLEIMIAAVRAATRDGPVELASVRFLQALSLNGDQQVTFNTRFDPETGRLEISSRSADETDWTLRAKGYGWQRKLEIDARPTGRNGNGAGPHRSLDGKEFYELAARHDLTYGTAFKGVTRVEFVSDRALLADVELPKGIETWSDRYTAHPAVLDSILQTALAVDDLNAGLLDDRPENAGKYKLKLPVGVHRLLIAGALPDKCFARFEAGEEDAGIYTVFGDDATPILRIENLETTSIGVFAGHLAEREAEPAYYIETMEPADDLRPGTADPRAGAGQSWIVLGDPDGISRGLEQALAVTGAQVNRIAFSGDGAQTAREIADLRAARGGHPFDGLVHAAALSAEGEPPEAVKDIVNGLLSFIGAEAGNADGASFARLCILSREGRAISGRQKTGAPDLPQSVLPGLSRTIANELASLQVRSIDLDEHALGDFPAIAQLILRDGPDSEIAVRAGTLYRPRFEPVAGSHLPPRKITLQPGKALTNYRVLMSEPGQIGNLLLQAAPVPEPGGGEVLVETAAVGLNFRDIMAATSLLPDELEGDAAWWRNLGLEFSGTVRAADPEGTGLKPGDRVVGMGKGLLRKLTTVPAAQLIRIPDGIDLLDAATVPTAFLTAVYALEHVARMRSGESVLIHLGTGGVGMAAIQVARACGAVIHASAGSEDKRDALRAMGIEHVHDSRNLDFVDHVLAATGGRGVDVVLNALSGAAIDKGLQCLAPFGRFVEIGKRDLAADKPIGLRALYENKSYSVIDLSVMQEERPDLLREVFTSVMERLAGGTFRPLVNTRFPASRAADAMRYLARAKHTGKVLVTFDEDELDVCCGPDAEFPVRTDAAYLVTGGTGGFGLDVAEHLARCGAGRVLLASRSGAVQAADQQRLANLRAAGCDARPVKLDVTDKAAVAALFGSQSETMPIAGVIHAAAVIDDGFLAQLDEERINTVLAPKVEGAWNLHLASEAAGCPLDFFVMFSSIAEAVGSVGQANYVAANGFLGGLAAYRRALGLPALSICWGALGDTGMIARSEALAGYLDSVGIKPVASATALDALRRLVNSDAAVATFAAIDWKSLGRALPSAGNASRLAPVMTREGEGNAPLVRLLSTSPRSAWHETICGQLRQEIASVLKMDKTAIPLDRPLMEIGLDSLSSFELKNRIEGLIEITIPVARFLQTPTIEGIAGLIEELYAETIRNAGKAGSGHEDQATGAAARTGSLPVLPRQRTALQLARLPLTSSFARAGLIHRAEARFDRGTGRKAIEAAVASLAGRHDAVRLRTDPEAAAPEHLHVSDDLPAVTSGQNTFMALPAEDGALWRFSLDQNNDLLTISAHAAAADAFSVLRAANEIKAHVSGKTPRGRPELAWKELAASGHRAEGEASHTRDRAYWRETLRDAKAVVFDGQAGLQPPPALGCARGGHGVLTATGKNANRFDEAVLLASFAHALSTVFGCDAVTVDCALSVDQDRNAPPAIGPLSSSFPVRLGIGNGNRSDRIRQARQGLEAAGPHRAYDSAQILRELGPHLPDEGAALSQFGLLWCDLPKDLGAGLDQLADMLCGNPNHVMRLQVSRSGDNCRFDLVFDPDIVTAGKAEAVAALVAGDRGLFLADDEPGLVWARNADLEHRLAKRADSLERTTQAARRKNRTAVRSGGASALPLTMQQSFLLNALQDPRATDDFRRFWTATRALHVTPGLDMARLRKAVETLVARHPALRTSFTGRNGSLCASVAAASEPAFLVEDVGDVNDDWISNRIEELEREIFDPLAGQLYRVTVLRCGKAGDILHCKGHHSIMDGWSMGQLVEELFLLYIGQPLAELECDPEIYLKRFSGVGDDETLRVREDYFRRLLRDAPPAPVLGKARTAPVNPYLLEAGPAGEHVINLGDATELHRFVRERALSPTAMLIAGTAQTIARHSGIDDVTICVPTAMRTDRILRSYVGWVATVMPVRCRVGAFSSLPELAADIFQQYRQTQSFLPADFLLRGGPLQRELTEGGSYLTLYEAGMLTAESGLIGGPLAALSRIGSQQELNLGSIRIRPLATNKVRTGSAYNLDVRSFEGDDGLNLRCGFDTGIFEENEAHGLFTEIVDRMASALGEGTAGPRPLHGETRREPISIS